MCVFIESGIRGYLGAVHFFNMGVFYHHPGPFATMGRCLFQKIGLEKNYYATALKIFSFFFTMRPWCQPFLIVL
jgi:hypothetical protein